MYTEPRSRPRITHGITQKTRTGCGNLYLTVNTDDDGLCEIFATLGKAGGCPGAMLEGAMRLSSLALRCGINPQRIADHLTGIRCPNAAMHERRWNLSCMDAIGRILSQILKGEPPFEPKGE